MSRPPLVLRRMLVVVVAALGGLVAAPEAAFAHSYLVSSTPADGAVVSAAPAHLSLLFSESIEAASTRVDIVGTDGRVHHPLSQRLISGAASNGSTQRAAVLDVVLPPLAPDAYRVSWETVSSDDLHRTSGILVFGVQRVVHASGLHENAPALPESGLRWLLFLAFAVALGGTLLARLYRPEDSPFADRAMGRSREIALLGSVCAVAVSILLLAQQLTASSQSVQHLFSTSYGTRWVVREAGLGLLVLTLVLRVRRPVGGPWLRALTVVSAIVTALGSALLGHAAAGRTLSPTRVGADALHLLAAATWAGTLVVAAVVVVPRLRTSGGEAVASRAALRRFLLPASACVATMVVTGVYLASGVVGSVDALLLTTYGRILMAKVALVLVAGLLALLNIASLHASLGSALGLRRLASGRQRFLVPEAVVAALVLGASALLTSGQPAREPQLVRAAAEQVQPVVDGAAADLQETVEVRPNLPGANVVVVGIFDTRRPSPGQVTGVDLLVTGTDGVGGPAVRLTPLPDSRWSVPLTLTSSGSVRLRVVVHRRGLLDAPASYAWVVAGATSPTDAAVVSTAPIAGPLRAAAAGLAIVFGLGAVATWRLRRRRRGKAPAPTPEAARELVTQHAVVQPLVELGHLQGDEPAVGRDGAAAQRSLA